MIPPPMATLTGILKRIVADNAFGLGRTCVDEGEPWASARGEPRGTA
jgi:hypothetical protein